MVNQWLVFRAYTGPLIMRAIMTFMSAMYSWRSGYGRSSSVLLSVTWKLSEETLCRSKTASDRHHPPSRSARWTKHALILIHMNTHLTCPLYSSLCTHAWHHPPSCSRNPCQGACWQGRGSHRGAFQKQVRALWYLWGDRTLHCVTALNEVGMNAHAANVWLEQPARGDRAPHRWIVKCVGVPGDVFMWGGHTWHCDLYSHINMTILIQSKLKFLEYKRKERSWGQLCYVLISDLWVVCMSWTTHSSSVKHPEVSSFYSVDVFFLLYFFLLRSKSSNCLVSQKSTKNLKRYSVYNDGEGKKGSQNLSRRNPENVVSGVQCKRIIMCLRPPAVAVVSGISSS